MTRNQARPYLTAMVVATQLVLSACGSNEPSAPGGSGGSPSSSGGSTASSGSGGAVSSGGSTASGSGGAVSGGGSTASGSGGAVSSGGSTASSGSGGSVSGGSAGSSGGGAFSPLCSAVPMTAAGEAPTKGGTCTASDTQLCYKTCGPSSSGFKSETCTGGTYAEQSGCTFPSGTDYSCYKIPATIDAACPTAIPQASQACDVATCTPCNMGGNYLDSSGASKAGYCICPAAGASGSRKWSCASTTAWPCPAGQGC